MFGFFPLLFVFGACGSSRGGCRCGNNRRTCCRRADFSRGGRPIERLDPGLVKITKTSNWSEVRVGDEPEVELTLVNLGMTAFDVVLSDAACGGCCVPGSVAVNGVAEPCADLDRGVALTLAPGETVTVHHRIRMCCPGCVSGAAVAHYAPSGSAWQCVCADTAVSNNLGWLVDYQSC